MWGTRLESRTNLGFVTEGQFSTSTSFSFRLFTENKKLLVDYAAGMAQSVYRLATGWKVRKSKPLEQEVLSSPHPSSSIPSADAAFITIGAWALSRGKAAGA